MKINVTLLGGDCPRTFILNGRIGQTMWNLKQVGSEGIALVEMSAYRLAAYIHSLKSMGFLIDTEREQHYGAYPDHHAWYRLNSSVSFTLPTKEAAE